MSRTAFPVSGINSIALISPRRKDEPRIVTVEEVERMKERLNLLSLRVRDTTF